MEFFNKYKKPITAAVVGALAAIILSNLINIPFWITGALIGVISVLFADQAVAIVDKQQAKFEEKQAAKKAQKASEES